MDEAQQKHEEAVAPFDDVRKAVVFALNASDVAPPTAFMNKAMAAVKYKPQRRAKSLEALHKIEEEMAPVKEARSLARISTPPLRGLDKAHQAGVILFHLDRLQPIQRALLAGLLMQATSPCDCRSPCCSGRRPRLEWLSAAREVEEYLRSRAEVVKEPGKKGLSSQPTLRRRIVEGYLRRWEETLVDLAGRSGVSLSTAAKHRELLTSHLQEVELEAWRALSEIFDQAGITGAHL